MHLFFTTKKSKLINIVTIKYTLDLTSIQFNSPCMGFSCFNNLRIIQSQKRRKSVEGRHAWNNNRAFIIYAKVIRGSAKQVKD